MPISKTECAAMHGKHRHGCCAPLSPCTFCALKPYRIAPLGTQEAARDLDMKRQGHHCPTALGMSCLESSTARTVIDLPAGIACMCLTEQSTSQLDRRVDRHMQLQDKSLYCTQSCMCPAAVQLCLPSASAMSLDFSRLSSISRASVSSAGK